MTTSDVNIRRLRPDELPVLKRIRLASLQDSPDAYGRTFEEESAFLDEQWASRVALGASDPDWATFLAEIDGAAVGMVGTGIADDRDFVWLYAMWVHPDARRKRVAATLVETVVDWATGKTVPSIKLHVTVGNDAALRLYGSFGFRDTGQRDPLREGSPLQTILMERPLP